MKNKQPKKQKTAHFMLEFCLIIIALCSLYIIHEVEVVVRIIISTPQVAVIDIIYVWWKWLCFVLTAPYDYFMLSDNDYLNFMLHDTD